MGGSGLGGDLDGEEDEDEGEDESMFVGGTVTLGGVGQGEAARDRGLAQLRKVAQTVDVLDRAAVLDVLCVYCAVADGTAVV